MSLYGTGSTSQHMRTFQGGRRQRLWRSLLPLHRETTIDI